MSRPKTKQLKNRERFEIAVSVHGSTKKHICSSDEEGSAVERVLRSYAKDKPELLFVKRLGILPKRRAN